MNYFKIYDSIINRARTRNLEGHKERHHIVPRCMGGTNSKENLVYLTAREHYIAHQLLVNMYPENHGLKYAAYMMTIGPKGERTTNRLYSWLKEAYSANKVKSKGFKGRKHSEETKAKMRAKRALRGPMPKELREQISKTKSGVKMSESAKKSFNEKRLSNPDWYKAVWGGRPKSEDTKAKISAANKGRKFPQQVCPHCGKVGAGPNMKRYHMDNCKNQNSPKFT